MAWWRAAPGRSTTAWHALRDALGAALAKPGATLDGACEEIIQALRQRGEDDLTLLLARIR